MKHVIFATLLAAFAATGQFVATGQALAVDSVLPVTGGRLAHEKPFLNPTPQRLEESSPARSLDVSRGFKVDDRTGRLYDAVTFLTPSPRGVRVSIDCGEKYSRYGIPAVKGAYSLRITSKGIDIYGYDEVGAFYGLQTLRQILKDADNGKIRCVNVADYPSLPRRGLIEGFYGEPWSHDVRLSLMDFLGANKMNLYVYGPKDDPYHRTPHWRHPYPDDKAREIKELVEAARRNRVDFVWAVHPGGDIRWDKADYDSLVAKFDMMYGLGVRAFAVFFDDISGEGTNPARQVEFLNNLNRDFIHAKGDVSGLVLCPTEYTRERSRKSKVDGLGVYGQSLDPDIQVMFTGDEVCADFTKGTLDFFKGKTRRPAFFWWNYPVTDYCPNIILQGPVYGMDSSVTADDAVAFASNPMEHGEASRLALYGVADYAWNPSAYNAVDNWERALVEMMPGASDAYRTFAIHSGDTADGARAGYRRDESWETEIFPVDDYTPGQFDSLRAEFAKVAQTPAVMEANAGDGRLVKELRPWLVEFEKLGRRGLRTLDLIKMYPSATAADFWKAYVANIMTPQEKADYQAHASGTMKLQPFYDRAMRSLASGFYARCRGTRPASCPVTIGSFENVGNPTGGRLSDGDMTTHYASVKHQRNGDWLGLDLGEVRRVGAISIVQGRDDSDKDIFANAVLEASLDGKTWSPVVETPFVNERYIAWHGTPFDARMVRLRRLDGKYKNWLRIREFQVSSATPDDIPVVVDDSDYAGLISVFDGNPVTWFSLAGKSVDFGRRSGVEKLTLLLGDSPVVTIEQLDATGNVVAKSLTTEPYTVIDLDARAKRVRLSGKADIHEIF